MTIAGLQKMTLLDYPGKVACTVFLQGCNFRCPFCHNSDLLTGTASQSITQEQLLTFLEKRRGLLDGVCITGGEPTLQPDLKDLIRAIRAMGYLVKLDTNGSRPQVLRELVEEGLLDYVAMDVKNSPQAYARTAGAKEAAWKGVEESLRFLLEGHVDYELRTTVVAQLHSRECIRQMGQWLVELVPGMKPKRLFLQPFTDRESVLESGLRTPQKDEMATFRQILLPFAEKVEIRGQD